MAESKRTFEEWMESFTPEKFQETQETYADIVAKYYGDPDFKAEVDSNPTGALKKAGLEVPDGAAVKLLFNSEKVLHIVLPVPFAEQ